MLTEIEIRKVFSWEPYRDDWPVNRNYRDESISVYFGDLIDMFLNNNAFSSIQMEDGGMSNYIDFMCYRKGERQFSGVGILVMISLCAPIAAFGMTEINVSDKSWGNNGILPEEVGIVSGEDLQSIELEIKRILLNFNIEMIDSRFASQLLPKDVFESLDVPVSDKYLFGIFQMGN